MLSRVNSNYITYGTLFWYHIVSAGWVSAHSVLMSSDHELRKLGNLTKDECELVRRWAAKSVLASGFVSGKILNTPYNVLLYQQWIFWRIHGDNSMWPEKQSSIWHLSSMMVDGFLVLNRGTLTLLFQAWLNIISPSKVIYFHHGGTHETVGESWHKPS